MSTVPPTPTPRPPPLTHHQILALVPPYARGGYQLDLAASQRADRRLAFRPRYWPGTAVGERALVEWLNLEVFASGSAELTRTLVHPCGLRATVQASGAEAADLLARVLSVPAQRQFRSAAGYTLARSYVVADARGRAAAPTGLPAAVFTAGEVQVQGLGLILSVPPLRGVSADLKLQSLSEPLALPQDLLAVLGWSWARLISTPSGWTSKLRLRGSPARRTALAEQALERAAGHLARVLAAPPGQFHDHHYRARLGVVFRRAIPLLTPLVLAATILLMPRVDSGPGPGLWLLLYHVPTLLVVLSFCLQELPQLEIPPWPRRSTAASWRAAQAPDQAVAGTQRAPG